MSRDDVKLNGIIEYGLGSILFFGFFSELEVMINRDKRGHSYGGVRGEILGSPLDELLRKHLSRMFSFIKIAIRYRRNSDHKRCQLAG